MAISPLSTPSLTGLQQAQRNQALALARLSAGSRINAAAEDPAGLVISQQMLASLGGLDKASNNLAETSSLLQTADGGLEQTQSILNQQRALALQASNSGTLDPEQRAALNQQFQDLGKALDLVASSTSFGQKNLLDGSYRNQAIQTGGESGQSLDLSLTTAVSGTADGYSQQGLATAGANLLSESGAGDALQRIDRALEAVSSQRGSLGALQADTVDSLRSSLATTIANLTEAQSTIADSDMAEESANRARSTILGQAGIAALAQHNQSASRVLQLLGTG